MTVELPALAQVEPGRPITANAWNEILNSLGLLRDAVNAIGSGELQVTVHLAGDTGTFIPRAEVIAVSQDTGMAIRAVQPFPGRDAHTVFGMAKGDWDIYIQAPDYMVDTRTVSYPEETAVSVGIKPDGKAVPDLFGLRLSQAKSAIKDAGMSISRILDSAGKSHTVEDAPSTMRVLYQMPLPGEMINPDIDRIRLVIAAEVEITGMVKVPDVSGLTPNQATAKLAEFGLVLEQKTRKTGE